MSSFALTSPFDTSTHTDTGSLPSTEVLSQNSTVDISKYPFYGRGSDLYDSIADILSGTAPSSVNTAQQPGDRACAWFTGDGDVPGRLKSTPVAHGRGFAPTLVSVSSTVMQVISRQILTFSIAAPEGQEGNKVCNECFKAALEVKDGWETMSPIPFQILKARMSETGHAKLVYEKLFKNWIGHGIRQEDSGYWYCDHSQLRAGARFGETPVEVWCRWHVTEVSGRWVATLQDPSAEVEEAKKDYDLQQKQNCLAGRPEGSENTEDIIV